MTKKDAAQSFLRWLPLLAIVVAGSVAWGAMNSGISHNAAELEKKADKDTVDTHFGYIRSQLQDIQGRLP